MLVVTQKKMLSDDKQVHQPTDKYNFRSVNDIGIAVAAFFLCSLGLFFFLLFVSHYVRFCWDIMVLVSASVDVVNTTFTYTHTSFGNMVMSHGYCVGCRITTNLRNINVRSTGLVKRLALFILAEVTIAPLRDSTSAFIFKHVQCTFYFFLCIY